MKMPVCVGTPYRVIALNPSPLMSRCQCDDMTSHRESIMVILSGIKWGLFERSENV